jgi:hypothetical protein
MDILIQQEIALHQYEIRHNKSEVIRLLHHEFREVGQSGNSYDFRTIIELMPQGKSSKGFIHSQDYECVELAPTVMLLLYKSAWNDGLGNYSHYAKRSSIWVLVDGQWQMKYHQGTSCEEFKLTQNMSAATLQTELW